MFSSKLHTKAYIRKKKALNLYNYFNGMILVNYSYCVMKEQKRGQIKASKK